MVRSGLTPIEVNVSTSSWTTRAAEIESGGVVSEGLVPEQELSCSHAVYVCHVRCPIDPAFQATYTPDELTCLHDDYVKFWETREVGSTNSCEYAVDTPKDSGDIDVALPFPIRVALSRESMAGGVGEPRSVEYCSRDRLASSVRSHYPRAGKR